MVAVFLRLPNRAYEQVRAKRFGPIAAGGSPRVQPSTAGPGGLGWVLSHQKISDTEGGFVGTLDSLDNFGKSVASLGDRQRTLVGASAPPGSRA